METQKIPITARCPIRTTLELVGGKWKLLILFQLYQSQALRPSEIKTLIPEISEKMLMQELKSLVENKLILKENSGSHHITYRLSAAGQHIAPLIEAMVLFAKAYENENFKK